ncbi:leucine-rich repeat domain-containing protein [Desulfococcaceae bacterium HSG8]|nr:leucine-rich repeat domain-containing protein [Desulfococcaceae bacterium HSG8]
MNCFTLTMAIIALMMIKIGRIRSLVKGIFVILLLVQFFNPQPSLAATDCSTVTVIPAAECECLLDLYNSTDGPNWADSATNKWNTDQDPSGWAGVTVEDEHVTNLFLFKKQLNGTIPESLGNLTKLESLYLGSNELSGSIPDTLGRLTSLSQLSLSENQLSETIPDSLGSLTDLYFLDLSSNQLSGPIPDSLGSLTSLSQLWLSFNQLSGPIPDLSQLTNLSDLSLRWNQLSGPIPESFGSLTSLSQLSLSGNRLSGDIPSSFSSLTNLQDIALSFNQLSGTIPDSLGSLTNLQHLYLHGNQLSGPIPDLSQLTNLQHLYLHGNQLSGPIPDLSKLIELSDLWLSGNQLSGPIPDLSQLTNLSDLDLSSNQLSGTIPGSFGNLTKLNLSGNQLSGPIPDSLGSLTNLQHLYLHGNQLSGPIPDLSQLTNLQHLYLHGNQLSGPIPDLSQLTNLSDLDLSSNQLSGPIPDLSQLTSLFDLNLSTNQLSGSIPDLSQLTSLSDLNLSTNQLSGPIPDSLGSLTNLQTLDLSGNRLSGDIPSSFSNLSNLDLGYNQLSVSDLYTGYYWADTQASKHITGMVKLGEAGVSGVEVTASNWDIPNGFTSAKTDENGNFDILVSGGKWEISVPQADNADWVSPDEPQIAEFADDMAEETKEKPITLQASAGKLTGRLLDPDGNPLNVPDDCGCECNCAVWIEVVNSDTGDYLSVNPDADTRFSFPLTGGNFEISVWLDDVRYPDYVSPVLDPVRFSADHDLGDIPLKERTGASVHGRVLLDETGTPAVSAEVSLYNYYHDFIRTVFTGQDGTFIIKGLEAGDYNIEIEPPSGNDAVRGIRDISFAVEADDVNMGDNTLPGNSKKIQGTVKRGDNDAPVKDVRITAYNWDIYEFREAVTGESGTFEIQVSGGVWEVEVLQDDEADWISPNYLYEIEFASDSSEETELLDDIRLETAAGKLTGRVVGADGSLFSDNSYNFISIDAYDYESGDYRYVWPDQDGSFSLPLPAGNYEVLIWTDPEPQKDPDTEEFPEYYKNDNGSPAPQIISFSEDTALGDIQLLKRSKVISGTVKDSRGKGMSGVFMDVWQPATGAYYWIETDASGNYEIKVPPGTWEVSPCVIEDSDNLFTEPPREVVFGTTDGDNKTVSFQLEKVASMILGKVEDKDGNPLTDLDAWVYARSEESPESVSETWVENGEFRLGVPGGELRIGLFLPAESEYAFAEEKSFPLERTARGGELTTAQAAIAEMYPYEKRPLGRKRQEGVPTSSLTFTLEKNDALITGFLKDSAGSPVTYISGYVFVTPSGGGSSLHSGDVDPDTGGFKILVSEGTWNLSYSLETDEYMSHPTVPKQIKVGPGGITEDITLILLDGVVTGKVQDIEGNTVPNIQVWARGDVSGSIFETRALTDSEGVFNILVPNQGTWTLGTAVDDAEEESDSEGRQYSRMRKKKSSPKTSGSAAAYFRLTSRSLLRLKTGGVPQSIITQSGRIKNRIYRSESLFVSALQSTIGKSDTDKYKSLFLKYATPGGKKKRSPLTRITGREDEDMLLTLRLPDTILEGTATLDGEAGKGVFISAYSPDGQKAQTYTDESGVFRLDVARAAEDENNIWKVTAVRKPAVRKPVGESSYYRSDEVQADISGTAGTADSPQTVPVTPELELRDTGISLPAPETGNFNVEKGWTHTLSDGTLIRIPGNAIPTEEKEVNVLVEPKVEGVPDNAEDIVVGYGYAISVYEKKSRKEIVTLNKGKEMVITFRCTEAQLNELNIPSQDIRPASFMDATDAWQPVRSFTIKEEEETFKIDFKADHFGLWALAATRSAAPIGDVEKGDVNNSGTVGLDDVIQALKACTQSPSTAYKEADVSGDGRIGLEEVVYILHTIAR